LAVATSTDPNRYGAGFSAIADSELVPSFLKLLPYRSDVLRLSEDNWLDRGPTGQALLVSELERKLRAYQDIYQDQRKWKDLGADDPGLDVYPVPLDVLP
jgi:serine/threonine-protein kinase PpkA